MSKIGLNLIATPLSHYARKVRILLDLYQVPYEMTNIIGSNIALTKLPSQVGDNPLMKVPVLAHGSEWLIESDHIASYVVSQFDPSDKYKVDTKVIFDLNTRAMLNGIMNEQLKVIVAGRHGVPVDQFSYFNKSRDAVSNGLSWLENNHSKFTPNTPTYREFHLTCLWDHLVYYDFVPEQHTKYPRLHEIVNKISEDPVVRQSAPSVVVPK
jgi:glutathione S-transferase